MEHSPIIPMCSMESTAKPSRLPLNSGSSLSLFLPLLIAALSFPLFLLNNFLEYLRSTACRK